MLPLDDLLVFDLSRILSGPYCSMYLGDFGARVIKLEHPDGGDDTRGFGPPFVGGESTYFMSINRNKESVAIDFKHARGLHTGQARRWIRFRGGHADSRSHSAQPRRVCRRSTARSAMDSRTQRVLRVLGDYRRTIREACHKG